MAIGGIEHPLGQGGGRLVRQQNVKSAGRAAARQYSHFTSGVRMMRVMHARNVQNSRLMWPSCPGCGCRTWPATFWAGWPGASRRTGRRVMAIRCGSWKRLSSGSGFGAVVIGPPTGFASGRTAAPPMDALGVLPHCRRPAPGLNPV